MPSPPELRKAAAASADVAANRRQILLGGTLAVGALSADIPGQAAETPLLVSERMVVGLFSAIPTTDVPTAVKLISTCGWSVPGTGMANYVADAAIDPAFVKSHPATSAMSRNGRGFRLADPEVSASVTGASPLLPDNGPALQLAIDEVASRGGGRVLLPSGTYRFTTTLKMRSGVDLVGVGKAGSVLRYDGTGVAIDAVGTANARRIFQLRDLSLVGSRANIASVGIQLAWNQRSLPMMDHVCIAGFGRYGIEFVGNNWLLTFRDVEIHDCGRAVPGGCGIFRRSGDKDFDALADVKFFGLVVEACGHPQSSGGAVTFPCAPPFETQGLWFHGCCIEGNFGAAEMSFERLDLLSIDQSYFEVAIPTGQSRNGIQLAECQATITNCRCSSDVGNRYGEMIVATANSAVALTGNSWDSDFGSADVSSSPSSQIDYTDFTKRGKSPMRLKMQKLD